MSIKVDIWAQFDARPWSGAVVGEFGPSSDDVQILTFADGTGPTAGIFSTAEEFVSGYGSPAWDVDEPDRRDLTSDARDNWDGTGTITIDIDPTTGHLRFSLSGGTPGTLSITGSTDAAAFGLDSTAFPTAAATSYVAPNPFSREVLRGETITIEAETTNDVTIPDRTAYEARVMHLVRQAGRGGYTSGGNDRDDAAGVYTLAYALNLALGDGDWQLRCHIDDYGHCVITWPSSLHSSAIIWTDDAFAAKLGFANDTDLDTFEVADGIAKQRGYMPVRTNYHSETGLSAPYTPRNTTQGEGALLFNVGAAGYFPGSHTANPLSIYVDSHISGQSTSTGVDLEHHLIRRFAPNFTPTTPARVLFNRDWREFLNANDFTASEPGASTLYSIDRCKSARRVRRHPEDSREIAPDFTEGDGILAEVTILVTDAQD